jgi:hypothetical protein
MAADLFQNYPDGAKIVIHSGAPEARGSPFATF